MQKICKKMISGTGSHEKVQEAIVVVVIVLLLLIIIRVESSSSSWRSEYKALD
jgi:hypothetical protein